MSDTSPARRPPAPPPPGEPDPASPATSVAELRAALAEVRLPVRRIILQQRIDRLEQLRAALQAKVTEARAACGTTGDTTT